jgi:hypothetical protein
MRALLETLKALDTAAKAGGFPERELMTGGSPRARATASDPRTSQPTRT